MKIIARVDRQTFLVQITADEMDALAGKSVGNNNYYERSQRDVEMGTTFNISAAWQRLNRDERRKEEVAVIRRQLQNLIEGLDIIEPFIEEPPTKREVPA